MANNYSQFSTTIAATKEQGEFLLSWLNEQLSREDDGSDEEAECYAALDCVELADDGIWIYGDSGLPDPLVDGLVAMLARFRDMPPIIIEGADTCDKLRPDNFGGWVTLITCSGARSKSTYQIGKELLDAHHRGPADD